MSRRQRRTLEIFNISFLDVISCGFGAIILLLVIVKISEPLVIKESETELSSRLQQVQEKLWMLQQEIQRVDQALFSGNRKLAASGEELARLQAELNKTENRQADVRLEQRSQAAIEQQLAQARQRLSDEQKRLLGAQHRRPQSDALIGGVPVDSEYIIFIIDTSGSMQKYAWPLVQKKVAEVLKIYPRVKGIQVLNDMGEYMFSQYKGRWITDTQARRKAILKRLAGWTPFSNSSPVEGVEAAIRGFYSPDKKISLYVFGDDFSRGSIEQVIDTVDRLNRTDDTDGRRVRIHAVGFPVIFQHSSNHLSAVRFAALMRKLAETNNGSFVGLNSSQ